MTSKSRRVREIGTELARASHTLKVSVENKAKKKKVFEKEEGKTLETHIYTHTGVFYIILYHSGRKYNT